MIADETPVYLGIALTLFLVFAMVFFAVMAWSIWKHDR